MKWMWTALLLLVPALLPAAKNLEVYFIDVEGGQSTLVVSPAGDSLLIDSGWGGQNRRDATRIAAAAKDAGVKRIDYLVTTHFHTDHVGGIPQLAEKLPIRNFVDHGASVETGRDPQILYNMYSSYRDKGTHILAKPGEALPVKGIDVQVLSSNGDVLRAPLAGAGMPGARCAEFHPQDADASENARSVGVLVTYGSFRMLDLGDLTWNREFDLVCPSNKIGTVDLFVVSHHGSKLSNSPQLVQSVAPRVAIMNNSARKGGDPEVWQTVHDSPGLLDLWQLHFAVAAGKPRNSADLLIANVDEICEGKWIKMTAMRDGSFTVYNTRNKYEKTYRK